MIIFYVIGGLTAAWAVLVAVLGIRHERFPATPGATRIVMAISVVLVAASIGAAVVTGILEEAEHTEESEAL